MSDPPPLPGLKNSHSTEYFGFQKSTRYDACWQTILIARRFQLFYTPAAAAAANVQKMTNKRYATSIHGQNLSKPYKSVEINPGSTLFLASQDALEVMRVTQNREACPHQNG